MDVVEGGGRGRPSFPPTSARVFVPRKTLRYVLPSELETFLIINRAVIFAVTPQITKIQFEINHSTVTIIGNVSE